MLFRHNYRNSNNHQTQNKWLDWGKVKEHCRSLYTRVYFCEETHRCGLNKATWKVQQQIRKTDLWWLDTMNPFFFFPCKILCFLSPLIKSFSKSLHLLHLSSLSQMWSKATTSLSDERSFPLSQTEGQGGWLTLHPLDSFDHLVFEEFLVGFNKNISNEVWRAWFGLFFAESNLAQALLIGTILQSQFQSG